MDLEAYIGRLQALAETGSQKAIDSILVPASNALLANIKNRVIREGKNTNEGKIGNYSTKPAYYTKDQFIQKSKFKGVGKNGGTKYADGQSHRSMYLPQGYKQLRDIQGRETATVNQEYTGSFMKSYEMVVSKGEIILGLTSQRSKKIKQGLEKKYGKTLYASKAEIAAFNKEVANLSQETFVKIFNA